MRKKEEYKTLTIRLPVEMWKTLKLAIIYGKIDSTQQAVVDSLKQFLETLEE